MSTKKSESKKGNNWLEIYSNNKVLIWLLIIILVLIVLLKVTDNKNTPTVPTNDNVEITIEPRNNLMVGIGNSISLKANINVVNAVVVWNSSDTSIAKVENGNVNGVNYGKAKITAAYYDSNGVKYEDSCYVTVVAGDANVSLKDISFPNGELYMPVGSEYKLNLELTPANALVSEKVFTSNDESVATVSQDGTITARRTGNARIVATVNGQYKVTKDVYVGNEYSKAELLISPTSLSFSTDTRKVKIGSTEKLSYSITPSNADRSKLTWSSSEPSIVSVNQSGEITAKSEGETTITVTSFNGKRADIIVSVYQEIVPVTDIVVTSSTINMDAGKTLTINPVVRPTNASNQGLSYSSVDPSIVSVSVSGIGDSATLSALKKGETTVIISSGKIEKRITVKVTGNGNNSEINEDGNDLPTTIKVRSNKNNLAKSYDEVKEIPVSGDTDVSVALSVGVGKIKYCYSKYEDSLCKPDQEKYSDGIITIPSGDIYVLRIIKYDYNDNEISSSSPNYVNGVLYYYINTKSVSKLYTVSGAYSSATLATAYPSKVGNKVTIKVNNASRYLNVCYATNTTCMPNTRVSDTYTITIEKEGTTRIYINEYDVNNSKVGNTEIYYVYVKPTSEDNTSNTGNDTITINTGSNVRVYGLGVYTKTLVGKFLSATVNSEVDFNTVRFCYKVVNKGAYGTCNLDLTSNSVPVHNGGSYFHPQEENKTYYGTVTSTKIRELVFDIDGLDNLYDSSDTNKDVILEFAVKSSQGFTNPIKVRINMVKREGTSSTWNSTFIR